jgi:hypothetical protein
VVKKRSFKGDAVRRIDYVCLDNRVNWDVTGKKGFSDHMLRRGDGKKDFFCKGQVMGRVVEVLVAM